MAFAFENEGFIGNPTQELQELSVVNFMASKGYEPVYTDKGLSSFRQPKFACVGKERVSFNSAVRMHNKESNEVFQGFQALHGTTFEEYVSNSKNEDNLIALFAGTTKIVKRAKLQFNRKTGIQCQSDKVEFMTKRDFAHYREFIGA